MEIIGRLTADAVVNETKAGKKVVNFSLAINDSYKPKGSTELQKLVTFVNCSYWINPGVATYLTKGTLVECNGRIGVHAWTTKESEPKAGLNLHVNFLKLHGRSTSAVATAAPQEPVNSEHASDATDDLPF